VRPDGIPLYFGGASQAAVRVGAEHADVYMLWGEPLAQIAERIAGIRVRAGEHGRTVRFSLSVRPIVAATEGAAWRRAELIRAATEHRLAEATARRENGGNGSKDAGGRLFGFRESTSVGSERLQRQGAQSDVHDDRLWYGITKLTGPGGNSTALVGTPAQVADALLAYRRVGVDTFLIRGFDPLDDVIDWGRELVPLLRDGAARTPVSQAPASQDHASQEQADHTNVPEPSPLPG
jgi:alkanesulfonate monooxygenase